MTRHFRTLLDLDTRELVAVLDLAARLKGERRRGVPHPLLEGRSAALIFHKPSLRTKVSFEMAMAQLGGGSTFLTQAEIGLESREAVKDVARVLARYVDVIVFRTFAQRRVEEMAEWSSAPVVNALTDTDHPCQILGDLLTVLERRGSLEGARIAWLGDGNNVCKSWIDAAVLLPIDLRIAVGPGYDPPADALARAESQGAGQVRVFRNPVEAVKSAEVIYTDVWASMGQEGDAARRRADLRPFQVNRAVVESADAKVMVMHCLPAHRDEEITDEVMEGRASAVFDQAENRLHAQKALLVRLLADGERREERRF